MYHTWTPAGPLLVPSIPASTFYPQMKYSSILISQRAILKLCKTVFTLIIYTYSLSEQ